MHLAAKNTISLKTVDLFLHPPEVSELFKSMGAVAEKKPTSNCFSARHPPKFKTFSLGELKRSVHLFHLFRSFAGIPLDIKREKTYCLLYSCDLKFTHEIHSRK